MNKVGANKSVITRSGVASTSNSCRFAAALVNRKFVKRSNLEATKSIPSLPTQSPNRAASAKEPRVGKSHSAARTVPLTAHAHQNAAKLRSNNISAHAIPPGTSTNREAGPNRFNTNKGSNTQQTSPANKAVNSLTSH